MMTTFPDFTTLTLDDQGASPPALPTADQPGWQTPESIVLKTHYGPADSQDLDFTTQVFLTNDRDLAAEDLADGTSHDGPRAQGAEPLYHDVPKDVARYAAAANDFCVARWC